MSRDIIEIIGVSTAERPIKGLALDKSLYIYDTKQEVLDEQAISNERVASLTVWAKDIAKFMTFSADGSTYEEKDLPSGDADLSSYVKKYTDAELNKLFVSHQGKYGDDRNFYPVELSQDVNGWTQLAFTENMIFKSKAKDTGEIGDKVLELKSGKVVSHKDFEVLGNTIYDGDTSQPTNLINRKALDDYVSTDTDEKIAADKAKGEWIGGVFKDTINDDGNPEDSFTCNDPKQWLEYRKTAFNGSFALTVNQGQYLISSEIVIHLHISSGMTSAPFKVVTNDGKEVTRTIRVGEKWRFYLRSGATPYFELIDDGMQSGVTDSNFDGEGFGVPSSRNVSHGLITQDEITGNWTNNSSEPGDLTINLLSTNGVNNWRFYYTFPLGTLNSRKLIVQVDDKPSTTKTVRSGETWLCEIKGGRFYDDFFWQKIIDNQSTFIADEAKLLIEENNDEIITPNKGDQFHLIDADKSSGYGDNGSITYYGPNYSGGQSSVLINNLANSKSYFVHKETGSSNGFAILHESYVSQIYNQDLTGISELTMLFGPKSRGRYAKNNQVTPAGMVLNWNGEYLPDTEDPNDLNPSSWIDLDGNVTTEWSKAGIKTACYSVGVTANDGSALLKRGDVFCHDNAGVKTSTFTADSNSEFFVIPIKTGGGTFNDLKLFPLFMSRFYKLQNEWDSYTFDNSADCVGTILKISYDAAIAQEEQAEETNNMIQTQLFKMAAATVAEYPDSNFVINTEE